MRLLSLELKNFKRFQDAKLHLDCPLIALVGPNEAGKSSLLEALRHLDSDEPISATHVTRGAEYDPQSSFLTGLFLIEPEDLTGADVPHASVMPRWMILNKKGNGQFTVRLKPYPERRTDARAALGAAFTSPTLSDQLDVYLRPTDQSASDLLARAREAANSTDQTLSADELQALHQLQGLVRSPVDESNAGKLQDFIRLLSDAISVEGLDHPEALLRDVLYRRRPDILIFGDAERSLLSAYDLHVHATNPPAALRNLADLGRLDLTVLYSAIQAGDPGLVETILEKANDRLRGVFRQAWQQSEVTVRLRTDGTTLHLLITNPGGGYSSIAERSDGLRIFVALTAFCAQHSTSADKILLIDEAESHLHYDAQADLVRMLTRQEVAKQVFYSTHSAGCLPQDLGTGIRIVEPVEGQQRSVVRNSFWTAGPGLTPLMLGMGATILAFTPARNAVISEGGADAVLMPSLLREAAGGLSQFRMISRSPREW